jgi:hypothetical protein
MSALWTETVPKRKGAGWDSIQTGTKSKVFRRYCYQIANNTATVING